MLDSTYNFLTYIKGTFLNRFIFQGKGNGIVLGGTGPMELGFLFVYLLTPHPALFYFFYLFYKKESDVEPSHFVCGWLLFSRGITCESNRTTQYTPRLHLPEYSQTLVSLVAVAVLWW